MTSALGFPSSPTLNQQYTVGTKLYSWSGTTWKIVATPSSGGLTEEEVQDFAAPLLNHSSHTNITASYDDEANKILLTAAGGGSSLTQEEIQDFVAPLLNHANHSNITASYDDIANKILLTGQAALTTEQAQDAVAPLLAHGSHSGITASYNDAQNKIILTSSGGSGGGTDIGLLIALS
jgi:1-deoxy-D-xylulose 5-phosphate reductoisomerase